jgi:hypothetical protein
VKCKNEMRLGKWTLSTVLVLTCENLNYSVICYQRLLLSFSQRNINEIRDCTDMNYI